MVHVMKGEALIAGTYAFSDTVTFCWQFLD